MLCCLCCLCVVSCSCNLQLDRSVHLTLKPQQEGHLEGEQEGQGGLGEGLQLVSHWGALNCGLIAVRTYVMGPIQSNAIHSPFHSNLHSMLTHTRTHTHSLTHTHAHTHNGRRHLLCCCLIDCLLISLFLLSLCPSRHCCH